MKRQGESRKLFEAVLEARNMAVHEGAWIRNRSDQLVELFLLLEEATLHELTSCLSRNGQFGGHRRTMASISPRTQNKPQQLVFLFTGPHNRWRLVSDEAIRCDHRMETNEVRKSRLH